MAKTATIIIPAYNESQVIERVLDDLVSSGILENCECLVIDDGSTDNTAKVCSKFPVRVISHPVNMGYGAALKTGIRHAKTDVVVSMDSDGQHSAKDALRVIDALQEADMVIGERDSASFQVKNRKLGKRIIRLVGEYLVEQKLPDFNSGLRAIRRECILPMLSIMPNGFSLSTTSTLAFIRQGYRIATVPIHVTEREGRASSVKFFKDGSRTLFLVLRMCMLFNPLKIFLPSSVFALLAGALWAMVGILGYGRLPNSGVILISLGLLLFFFGLIADQIAMLNLKTNDGGYADASS